MARVQTGPAVRHESVGSRLRASIVVNFSAAGVRSTGLATDLWFSAAENIQRVRDAGVEDGVFPLSADARSLPFAPDFFDAIVCVDSICYFGIDDLYLNYLARFVKPGGQVGIAGAGLMREIEVPLPII